MNRRTRILSVAGTAAILMALAVPAFATVSPQPLPPAPPAAGNYASYTLVTNVLFKGCSSAHDNLCEQSVESEYSGGLSLGESYFSSYFVAQYNYRTETTARNTLAVSLNTETTSYNAEVKKLSAETSNYTAEVKAYSTEVSKYNAVVKRLNTDCSRLKAHKLACS